MKRRTQLLCLTIPCALMLLASPTGTSAQDKEGPRQAEVQGFLDKPGYRPFSQARRQ